jgi:hypothetical protein
VLGQPPMEFIRTAETALQDVYVHMEVRATLQDMVHDIEMWHAVNIQRKLEWDLKSRLRLSNPGNQNESMRATRLVHGQVVHDLKIKPNKESFSTRRMCCHLLTTAAHLTRPEGRKLLVSYSSRTGHAKHNLLKRCTLQ